MKEINKIIEEIKSYENEEMCIILLSQKQNKALLKYITNLQERIDNAIEYIKSYLPNYDFDHTNLKKLLKILGDKE